jgi:hypothetical protein
MGISAARRGAVVAALAAAALVPAAAAGSAPHVQLAIVPLPKSELGAAGRPLRLARDSGVVSNVEAASEATGKVTVRRLKRLGRVTGYLLDYGNPFGNGGGVHQIQTEIDEYRTVADARHGLAFWRRDELKASQLKKFGIDATLKKLTISRLPGRQWAYAGTASIKGLKPIHGVDAEFRQGRYLLDVSVSAGSSSAAVRLAPTIARRFYARARLAFAGRLRATPATLPPPLKAGPPPHGPKPADLVLRKSDLGGPATILRRGYTRPKRALDPNALSAYDLKMTPAGSFPYLAQEVLVGGSKLEVQYFGAIALGAVASGFGSKAHATPVALGSVGDNARAELLQVPAGSATAYEGVVVLSHGAYLDFVIAASTSALTAADVKRLARLAAHRFDAGLAGR